MAKKPLKMFKVNNISEVRDVDALYCIKTATDTEFSIVVTDAFGAIVNLKDLQTPAGIQGIASDDGTIEVTGTTFKNIRLSATLVNAINSTLKAGDNISDLVNDAGYLTSFTEVDPIFQASEASNFVSGDKVNLDNQSGVNTGDETSTSIQTKRPLKTIDNKSLEGTGNIEIDYNTVINKPTEFPPSTHTHVISDITGLQGELDNKLDENNPSATGTLTLQTDPSILIDTFDILVRNPSSGVVSKVPEATYRKSSVDVPWTEVSGKPSTFPPSAHTHTKSQITDFAHTHPISDVTGLPTALDDLQLNKEDKANKNIANGYAGLDSSGKIIPTQLPALAITDTFVVASQAEMLALVAEVGDVVVRTDLNKSFILRVTGASTLANWQELLSPTSVDQTIIDGSTNSVSGNAVFDGLATKFPTPTGLTTNYLPKWNGSGFGNSQIFDNGTNIGIGTTTPLPYAKLNVEGTIISSLIDSYPSIAVSNEGTVGFPLLHLRNVKNGVDKAWNIENGRAVNGDLGFYNEGGQRITFTTNGRVLINKTNDDLTNQLQVAGTISASPATTANQVPTWGQVQAAARPYKVYTALLSQTGTNAPTATVLENTTGETPILSRVNVGIYKMGLTAPQSKTFVLSTPASNYLFQHISVAGDGVSVNISTAYLVGSTITPTDGLLQRTPIEIRIYP